jgi:hypothetical protein
MIKNCSRRWFAALLGVGWIPFHTLAQTDGSAELRTTLLDYNGSSARHYTVVWVTTGAGTFIKTLWKQGPSNWGSSEWGNHCGTWNTARAGSTAFDGYTSATAQNYTGTNSPVILTWNCRDAANSLMADGSYKFWVQYAENSGQGPYTTSGLLWTKGSTGATNAYPNQSTNFADMRVTWLPAQHPEPPTITSAAPTATGVVGVPYNFTCTATGSAPIGFFATGLPPGLRMSATGVISGVPTTNGTFNGTITAANGTLPDANQPFAIAVSLVPASLATARTSGTSLIMTGSGPANGVYSLLATTNVVQSADQWTPVATNSFDSTGRFSVTNTPAQNVPQRFYLLRVP